MTVPGLGTFRKNQRAAKNVRESRLRREALLETEEEKAAFRAQYGLNPIEDYGTY